MELRKAAITFDEIAQRLGCKDGADAYEVVHRALEATVQEPTDELRTLECERLDAMLRALWPAATAGKWLAIDRCLTIMERRARLLGLEGAREVEKPAGDPFAELDNVTPIRARPA